MTYKPCLRFSTVLAILFLALGLATRAQAQPARTTLMEDAYATLAQAKHDYKGHRVKAMKQIEMALSDIGWKIRGTGKVHEPQAASDAQLRNAESLLRQACPGLSATALKHVNAAIGQINDALAIK